MKNAPVNIWTGYQLVRFAHIQFSMIFYNVCMYVYILRLLVLKKKLVTKSIARLKNNKATGLMDFRSTYSNTVAKSYQGTYLNLFAEYSQMKACAKLAI